MCLAVVRLAAAAVVSVRGKSVLGAAALAGMLAGNTEVSAGVVPTGRRAGPGTVCWRG